eukprot:1157791-Pelagomonas_calceolata.AAC.1
MEAPKRWCQQMGRGSFLNPPPVRRNRRQGPVSQSKLLIEQQRANAKGCQMQMQRAANQGCVPLCE